VPERVFWLLYYEVTEPMVNLDPDKKELTVKIVYYGPDRSGKTVCLNYLYERYHHRVDSKEVMIKSLKNEPLFFDFFLLDVGKVKGYDVKVQFYTVPGGEKYGPTRRLVLKGVDGVVFVADSMVVRRESNIRSLREMEKNLSGLGRDPASVPIIFQYNKRDLDMSEIPILLIDSMNEDLNAALKHRAFPTSGLTGQNVVETMKQAVISTVSSVQNSLPRAKA
jgi:mutual gliding-motility protein MglA